MTTATTKRIDPVLLTLFVLLIGVGISAVLSASVFQGQRLMDDPYFFFRKQAMAAAIGLVLSFVVSRVSLVWLYRLSLPLLIFLTALLALLFVPGLGKTANGATSWFDLGLFSLQPSEPLKLILLLYLAHYFGGYFRDRQPEDLSLAEFSLPLAWILPGIVLVALQPDMGTAFLLLLFAGIVLFVSGFPFRFLFVFVLFFIPLFYIFLYKIEKNWKRVLGFIDPFADPTSDGYQLIQSFKAFYYGGLDGKGLGQGIQKINRLPEAQNDFIYAAIAEELGLFWSLGVIVLYAALLLKGFQIVMRLDNPRDKIMSAGILGMILAQALINMAVVTGTLPVTGIPLPFISYGGSHLITFFVAMGILLNISRNRPEQNAQ